MTASVAHPCTSRAEVLAVLREHFPALASEFKLSSLQLFGSFATDEATASSDVDLLGALSRACAIASPMNTLASAYR